MLRIRLLRIGKKNRPQFRLVAVPRRSASKTGRFFEVLGFYDPIKHTRDFRQERIKHWLFVGAQPSDTARNMLISAGILEGKKVAVHKKAKKAEQAPASP